MATKEEILGNDAGPFWLTHIDWSENQHRKTVAASLVKGVYSLELERPKKGKIHEPQATTRRWWESFGFELYDKLEDHRDSSYLGAIFKHKPTASSNNYSTAHNPPRYVIAFRGTIIKKPRNWRRDLEADINVIRHNLHEDPRSEIALQAVLKLVDEQGQENVWLAGHSLGSAIALLVGRYMVATKGFHLEAYLFNPPFASFTIQPFIKHEKIKNIIRTVRGFFTAGIVATVGSHLDLNPQQENPFSVLANWSPYLFVHKRDIICSGFIDHFEQRRIMGLIGAGEFGQIAMQTSTRSALYYKFYGSKRGKKREPIHLLPSARLFVNLSLSEGHAAHTIKQWFDRKIVCDDLSYKYA